MIMNLIIVAILALCFLINFRFPANVLISTNNVHFFVLRLTASSTECSLCKFAVQFVDSYLKNEKTQVSVI